MQGQAAPASQKDPEGWGPADKLTEVLESASLNMTKLGGYFRQHSMYSEQVNRWHQADQESNAQSVMGMA